MKGAVRILFALAGHCLRGVGWLTVAGGHALADAAKACERNAKSPSNDNEARR
jgi:hypothetical protein